VKLLFVSTAFPQPGDPQRAPYNLRLCEALARVHDVAVISPVPWTRRNTRVRPRVAVRVSYPALVYPPRVLRSTHAWWMWRSIRASARKAFDGEPPDAVISYWTWPDGAAAARLARTCGVPSVMLVGGSDVLVLATLSSHRRLIADTLAQASAVVTVGDQLRDAIEGLGVPGDRITVIRRGVDVNLFAPGNCVSARRRLGIPPFGTLLLWVGRLAQVKGPDLLLDALEPLVQSSWHCVMIGTGPMRRDLQRRIAGGPLRDRVSLVGTLQPHELADWYRAADALVVSSRSEGVPNVLYEARGCGTPVIAMNAGDISQFLDDEDRLVPPGDVAALRAAIADSVARPRARRAPAALPTWDDSAARLVDVIQAVRAGLNTTSPAATAPRQGNTTSRA